MNQPLDSLDDCPASPPISDLEDSDALEFSLEDPSNEIPTVVLPHRPITLEASGITDVGNGRSQNEDFFIIDNRVVTRRDPDNDQVHVRGLYILCDGIGGHAQGEVASRMAAETIALYFADRWQTVMPTVEDVQDAIYVTNQSLYALNESQTRQGNGRMGTTLVLALVQDTQICIAHVGDSRLYRVTSRCGLEQLTTDHEVGQRDIRRGIDPEVAYGRPDAYQLTQAIGPRPNAGVFPEIQSFTIAEDTLLLLCSDGMTDNDLLERFWESHLKPLLDFSNSLDSGLQHLVELANTENGHDNITVVGVRMKLAGSKSSAEPF